MVSVVEVSLPLEIPITGCELTPNVMLRRSDGSDRCISSEDIREKVIIDGCCIKYKWYRVQGDMKVCSIHRSLPATLQCEGCIKAKVPLSKSFHCSPECFKNSWRNHQLMHKWPQDGMLEKGTINDVNVGLNGSSIIATRNTLNAGLNGCATIHGFISLCDRNGSELFHEVGYNRTYTPTTEDIGYLLKLECTVVNATTGHAISFPFPLFTSHVIPAPIPTPRHMLSVRSGDLPRVTEFDVQISANGTFTVLSYNILADLYATHDKYSYCPPWALSWTYRRHNLLREILGYRADILCLQEVQSNHFNEFFAPELEKCGYVAVYKKKTSEVCMGSSQTIDGCATFFRRDGFSLVKKYEVEFNKAAQSLAEASTSALQKRVAVNRFLTDNVALIVVLKPTDYIYGTDALHPPQKSQLLCVANTHIHVDPEMKDVKLCHVHTLVKGLGKISESADIPILICGNFDSVPDSAPHMLLASGKVDPLHPDLGTDPVGILQPTSKFSHHLPLVSAYSALARVPDGNSLDGQSQCLDPISNEPVFTNCTKDFLGTLDYIFYTADLLAVESVLELLDVESIRKDTALPSPKWSSDHIALLAKFRCKSRTQR